MTPIHSVGGRWSSADGEVGAPHDPADHVGATPSEVVYTENKLTLRHYEPRTASSRTVPILVVYAIINRPSILDFRPDTSVVRRLLDAGFDIYLLDWGEPSRLDVHLGLDDYVARYLANCVEVVVERSGTAAPHLLGYCTGATLSVVFAALYPERVRTLGLLAAVLNFDAEGGIFRIWGPDGYSDPRGVVSAFGNAPGEWLAFEFSLVDPVEHYLARYLRLLEHLDEKEYRARFVRRLQWGFDSVDVAGGLYLQFLVDLYRENRLMEGSLTVGGRTVDVTNLTMPVLNVVGSEDQFIPAEASVPFVEALPSTDTTVIEFPTDHVGLSIDERSHAGLWPRVCDWFAAR